MKTRVRLFIWLWILSGIGVAHAQEVKTVHAEAKGEVVYIDYVLIGGAGAEAYKVSVYAIMDSFTVKLDSVSGDIGDKVVAGNNRIVWDAISEYPRFDGEIEFELRVIPAFFILKPRPNLILKRGTSYGFEWYGAGSNADSLQLDLHQDAQYVNGIGLAINTNNYRWDIPAKTKPGKNFQLKVTGTPKTGITGISPTFTIKRKVPLMLKVGPFIALGGIAAYLLTRPEEPPLPVPPLPCDPSIDPNCE